MPAEGSGGGQDEADATAAVGAALDVGVNFFDTAPGYGGGVSEQMLGKGLGRRRDEAIIATKVSGGEPTAEAVREECEKSLGDLGTDVIDLYQLHWPRRDVPFDETAKGIEDLQRAGKIRHFGVSNFLDEDFTAMLGVKRFESNQMLYNLLGRAIEYVCVDHCVRNDVGIICYSPLAQGLLTGKWRTPDDVPPARARTRLFSCQRETTYHNEPGHEEEAFGVLDAIGGICAEIGQEMGTVSLAWLLTRPGVTSVIAGARDPDQLRRNAWAGDLVLSEEIASRLTQATEALKANLGPNADVLQGAAKSRYR